MRRVGIESSPTVLAEIGPVRVREDRPSGGGPFQKGSSAMLWRHLGQVRAGLAAGLASGLILFGAPCALPRRPLTAQANHRQRRPGFQPRQLTFLAVGTRVIWTWSRADTGRIACTFRFATAQATG